MSELYLACLVINKLIIQFSYIDYFDMQSQNKVNLLCAILDERKTDPALLISMWLLWYSLSDNSSQSENLLALFSFLFSTVGA